MSRLDEVIKAAITDLSERGFVSVEQVEQWVRKINDAYTRAYPAESVARDMAARMRDIFKTEVVGGRIARGQKLPHWKITKLEPRLREELNKRILASANLIKLNRAEMISRTLSRFSGWAFSIPVGGRELGKATGTKTKRDTAQSIGKSLKSMTYEERRVMIDQSAKLRSSLTEIVATENGALFGVWESQFREGGYNARQDHKKRDGKPFIVPNNWAIQKGLMRSNAPTIDDQTKPGEEVYCRCQYVWYYNLRDAQKFGLLTEKGKEQLLKATK